MILGMSTSTFTLLHVLISLIGIGSGLIALYGLLNGRLLSGWTPLFLVSTVLTSVTGFLFPVEHLLPSHKVGILSLIVLAIANAALYLFHLAGKWRAIYVISVLTALYLNLLCRGCAVVPENPRSARHGTQRERTAVPGRADHRAAFFHCAGGLRDQALPGRSGTCNLEFPQVQEARSRVSSAQMDVIVCCQCSFSCSCLGSAQADSNTPFTVATSSRAAASIE